MQGAARADSYSGTWTITPSSTPGQVHLELRYRHSDFNGTQEWDDSHDVPIPRVRDNRFIISTDAGDFDAQGTFSGMQGGGIWTFVPNSDFAAQLQRRGLSAPDQKQQFELAMVDFKLSTLDTLLASGFAHPNVSDLVRMAEHGISNEYVAQLRGVQFSSKTIDSLVRLHDHGVTPQYMQGMQRLGYHPSADELVRLMDHGVTVAFVERMRSHGYTHLSADDLIRLRDSGF
jgi:hypothetical protein